jgi:hypothetical protein
VLLGLGDGGRKAVAGMIRPAARAETGTSESHQDVTFGNG